MVSVDTNILFKALADTAEQHAGASQFVASLARRTDVIISELVLVELYNLIRNEIVFGRKVTANEAVDTILAIRSNPCWSLAENAPVMDDVWRLARGKSFGRRRIFDARIGLMLRHHGVVEFATANVKDFKGMGFKKVWNPLD